MKKSLIFAAILVLSTSAYAEDKVTYKGTVEGGVTIENGNTETENYRGSMSLTTNYEIYENVFEADGANSKQDGNRTGEEYNISNQLKAAFHELYYGFIEVDFTEDRYQGFNYRVSELAGVGYHFVKEDNLKIFGELAAGARQTDYTATLNDEETAIGRVSGDINWKINKHVSFDHRTDFTFGEDNRLTELETGLKSFLNEDLYFRVAHELEHNSETPNQTVKNTDSKVIFTVGYEFE